MVEFHLLLTILVLSGVTAAEQLANSAINPDLVYQDVAGLHQVWKDVLIRHGAAPSGHAVHS